jgi:hypothetical protein
MFSEFWQYAKAHKKLWILPIVFLLLLLAVLIIFAETSAVAPFIYTLF